MVNTIIKHDRYKRKKKKEIVDDSPSPEIILVQRWSREISFDGLNEPLPSPSRTWSQPYKSQQLINRLQKAQDLHRVQDREREKGEKAGANAKTKRFHLCGFFVIIYTMSAKYWRGGCDILSEVQNEPNPGSSYQPNFYGQSVRRLRTAARGRKREERKNGSLAAGVLSSAEACLPAYTCTQHWKGAIQCWSYISYQRNTALSHVNQQLNKD